MKLFKKSGLFLSIVAVVFVVFNVVFYLLADTAGINNTTIISWVFMVLGFASFLTFTYLAKNKNNASTHVFMHLSLFGHCTAYIIADFILAALFTIIGAFVAIPPIWTVAIQLILLGVHLVIAISCLMAKDTVEEVQQQVKMKTSRMKGFRADSEMLVEYCTDAAAKNDFRKFAEAVRYSDPMSCDELMDVEDELEQIISEMKTLLTAGEIEAAQNKCKIANNILKERNKKCLMYK